MAVLLCLSTRLQRNGFPAIRGLFHLLPSMRWKVDFPELLSQAPRRSGRNRRDFGTRSWLAHCVEMIPPLIVIAAGMRGRASNQTACQWPNRQSDACSLPYQPEQTRSDVPRLVHQVASHLASQREAGGHVRSAKSIFSERVGPQRAHSILATKSRSPTEVVVELWLHADLVQPKT